MPKETILKDWTAYGDTQGFTAKGGRLDEPIDMSQPLKVYWVPGCSGCLRTKEFLNKHGVKFISVNAFADKAAFDELEKLGVKRIPIAARGKQWADGQVLPDLARIAGIKYDPTPKLSPAQLAERGVRVMSVAHKLMSSMPETDLATRLPGRPRSYRQLCCHIFQIFEVFLELVEDGWRLEFMSYLRDIPSDVVSIADLMKYTADIQARFSTWWRGKGGSTDFTVTADVYYGDVTLHHYFERTIWHATHHVRQLQTVCRGLGVNVDDGLRSEDLQGLPLPEEEYDDKIRLT